MERIQRQALHAWKLIFRHPITGEILSFTAPLPKDMAMVAGDTPWSISWNLLSLQAVMQIPMVQYYARSFFSAFSRIRHSPCSSRYLIFCSSAAYNAANSIAWMQALL